jgi:hypothetical protein
MSDCMQWAPPRPDHFPQNSSQRPWIGVLSCGYAIQTALQAFSNRCRTPGSWWRIHWDCRQVRQRSAKHSQETIQILRWHSRWRYRANAQPRVQPPRPSLQTPSGLFYRPPDVSVFPRPKYIIVEYELKHGRQCQRTAVPVSTDDPVPVGFARWPLKQSLTQSPCN